VHELTRVALRNKHRIRIIRNIEKGIIRHCGIEPYEVVLIRPGSLPKTTSGKVQRSRARELYLSGQLSVVERSVLNAAIARRVLPLLIYFQSRMWNLICCVLADLLNVEKVGVDDNFFELGGHSLLAVQLISRLRQTLGREIALRELFEFPTVRTLAQQLSRANFVTLAPITRADRDQALPLSWAQQRLWFIDQLAGTGAAYHIPAAVRLQDCWMSLHCRQHWIRLLQDTKYFAQCLRV